MIQLRDVEFLKCHFSVLCAPQRILHSHPLYWDSNRNLRQISQNQDKENQSCMHGVIPLNMREKCFFFLFFFLGNNMVKLTLQIHILS